MMTEEEKDYEELGDEEEQKHKLIQLADNNCKDIKRGGRKDSKKARASKANEQIGDLFSSRGRTEAEKL